METENRLARESSPYLRQHRHDPVDWYPWGEEAFARARELDRPLFLSIGYSACHWCHVMGHESFADPVTAAEMNDLVVAVKVDREERPDVDAVYMEAVQAATGHGGWPMSVFATPDGRPFFAGTYFPRDAGRGSPTFRAVLSAIGDAWSDQRQVVDDQADLLRDTVARRLAPLPAADGEARATAAADGLRAACIRLGEMFDAEEGGFGRSPKFPQPLLLDLLLTAHAEGIGTDLEPAPLDVVSTTLDAMAAGGIWDHLGGGFARYSVDREWLVPHFEKMLYDQALLARVYLHGWQVTGNGRWLTVAEEIVEYVLRDLRSPAGGLCSAEDADSEGEEGLFYTWTPDEIGGTLPPDLAAAATAWWMVEPGGNFEGRSILHRPSGDVEAPSDEIERARRLLFEKRATRVRPGLDDKVLAEWNAMMCATLAEGALATGNDAWRDAAEELGDVLLRRLRNPDGRVLRLPGGEDGHETIGYAADAAWVVEALVRLAECTGKARWLAGATELADQLLSLFEDLTDGGLFTTGNDAEVLVVRPRDMYDNVIPAANSVAVGALARLATMTGRDDLDRAARRLAAAGQALIERAPTAAPQLVMATHLIEAGSIEVVITGDRPDLLERAGAVFLPRSVLVWSSSEDGLDSPLLADRSPGLAYVCRFGACRLPAGTAEQLSVELGAAMEL
ncbi:MAG TPA: thioredoxin domain-containing protein [Acidimicrobiales bacterium]|jgi:hypothetical protein|nr:thioredoxin domain-containing protein [Acidimicrobiales bacterium]